VVHIPNSPFPPPPAKQLPFFSSVMSRRFFFASFLTGGYFGCPYVGGTPFFFFFFSILALFSSFFVPLGAWNLPEATRPLSFQITSPPRCDGGSWISLYPSPTLIGQDWHFRRGCKPLPPCPSNGSYSFFARGTTPPYTF